MTATTERSEQPATRVSGPRPVVAILGLVGLTLATRLPGLDRPRAFVFDEIYYALDAAELLRHGVEPAAAHPPLGKWLIAAGIQVAGFTPTGWRLAALLAGIALVLVTWWAARTVTDDPWLALLGAGLVALDGIAYVTGRLALLDVFVALATTVAAGATLAALRDRADAERLRRWRWVAALALGAGVAVKWARCGPGRWWPPCWSASNAGWPRRAARAAAGRSPSWPRSPSSPPASTWSPTAPGWPAPSGAAPGWSTVAASSPAGSAPSTGSRSGSTTSSSSSSSTPSSRSTTPRRRRRGRGRPSGRRRTSTASPAEPTTPPRP